MPSSASHPRVPPAAQPTRVYFDPYNSSSTGHQRAENRLATSTSWRDSRTRKLRSQFSAPLAAGGGERLFDSVGAGSLGFGRDGRKENGCWEKGAKGLRGDGWRDVRGMLENGGAAERQERRRSRERETEEVFPQETRWGLDHDRDDESNQGRAAADIEDSTAQERNEKKQSPTPPRTDANHPDDNDNDDSTTTSLVPASITSTPNPIFRGLTIHITGSTYPLVSDHRLKQLLSQHGAHISLTIARRTLTHVIVGAPSSSSASSPAPAPASSTSTPTSTQAVISTFFPSTSSSAFSSCSSSGAGGGLSARKLQREITRLRPLGGPGTRYVRVEWVLESLAAGRRLPESRFGVVDTGGAGVGSVKGFFSSGAGVGGGGPKKGGTKGVR